MKRLLVALLAVTLAGLTACGSDAETNATGANLDATASTADGSATTGPNSSNDDASSRTTTPVDDDSSLVNRVTRALTKPNGSPLDDDQAHCYAQALIGVLGADRIAPRFETEEVGPVDLTFTLLMFDYSDLNTTEAEATQIYEAAAKCGINFRTLMLKALIDEANNETGEDIPASYVKCVDKKLTEQLMHDYMIGVMTLGVMDMDPDVADKMITLIMYCDPATAEYMDDLKSDIADG